MQAQGRQPGVGRTTSLSACKRSRAVKPAIASIWDEAHLSVLNVRASSSPRFVRKLKKSATHETFNRDPTRFWNSSTSRCQQTCLRNRNAAGRENIVMIALVAQVPRTYLRPQSRHRALFPALCVSKLPGCFWGKRRWLRSGPLFAAIFAEVGCDGLWSYPTVIPAPERHLCVSASSYPSLEGRSLASFVPRSSTRSCLCAQGETVVNPHNPLFPRSEPFSSWKGASCQPLSIFEQKNCLCSLLRRLRRLLGALPDILRQ